LVCKSFKLWRYVSFILRKSLPLVIVALLFLATGVFAPGGCSGEPYKWIVDATPTVLFSNDAGHLYQTAEARIAYWLPEPKVFTGRVEVEDLNTHATVTTDTGAIGPGDKKGYRVRVPDINTASRFAFRLYDISGGAPGEFQNEIIKQWAPQRKWTVWLIPSSHIDLYSTANADLTPEQHRKILDTVCDLCDRYPDYTYQLETRLPVYEYMDGHRTPEQVDRMIRLIQQGRIDVGAQYSGAHQNSASGESYIQGQVAPWNQGVDLEQRYGIKPEFCAMFDTPGVVKQLPEFLNKAGVKNLVYAPNTSYHIQEMMGVPYIYRWKTDSGAEVLTWRTSYGYNQEKMSYFKLTNPDPRVQEDSVNEKLLQRQAGLDENGKVNPDLAYPFEQYAIPWDYGDNEPADSKPMDFMQSWNSRWAYPRVQMCSYADFLGNMESRYADRIPERQGQLGNPWEFVVMNQGVINLYDRYSQRSLCGAMKFWSLFDMLGGAGYPQEEVQSAWDNLAKLEAHDFFYGAKLDPDTGGLIPDYMNPDWAKAEWSLIAERNSRQAHSEGVSALASTVNTGGRLKIVVLNPLSFTRTDPVAVKAPTQQEDGKFILRDDVTGKEVPYQLIDASVYQDCFGRRPSMKNQNEHFKGAYPDSPEPSGKYVVFTAGNIGSIGYRTFSVIRRLAPPVYPTGLAVEPYALENRYYRVTLDPQTRAVASILDKELGKELVDGEAQVAGQHVFLNQFLKGTPSSDSANILINMEPFTNDRPTWQPIFDGLTRCSVKNWRSDFSGTVQVAQAGPVMGALVVSGRDDQNVPRRQSVVLYDGIKRIDFVNWVKSTGCIPLQRYAFSYPLKMDEDFKVSYHNLYTSCEIGEDELPGGATTHRHLGDWIEFEGPEHRVSIASPDVGPFTVGRADLNLVDDARYTVPDKPYYFPIYLDTCTWSAFVVPGSYTMRFSLSSGSAGDEGLSQRNGSSFGHPLAGAFLNTETGPLRAGACSLVSLNRQNVEIPVIKKPNSGGGMVLRLVETLGKSTPVTLSLASIFRCSGAYIAGLNEQPGAPLPHTASKVFLSLKPHEVVTLRLNLSGGF